MKPKKRVFCPAIKRSKMLFETKRKALDFIAWNGQELERDGKKAKNLRAYYCAACGGWHITSRNLSAEKRKKLDQQVESMIDSQSSNKPEKVVEPKKVEKKPEMTHFDYILTLPLTKIKGRKNLRKYVTSHINTVPKNLSTTTVYIIIKFLPDEAFKSEMSSPLSHDEAVKQAENLYNEILSNKIERSQVMNYVRWEFVYKRKINLHIISELERILNERPIKLGMYGSKENI